jgi:hypothetical protein
MACSGIEIGDNIGNPVTSKLKERDDDAIVRARSGK